MLDSMRCTKRVISPITIACTACGAVWVGAQLALDIHRFVRSVLVAEQGHSAAFEVEARSHGAFWVGAPVSTFPYVVIGHRMPKLRSYGANDNVLTHTHVNEHFAENGYHHFIQRGVKAADLSQTLSTYRGSVLSTAASELPSIGCCCCRHLFSRCTVWLKRFSIRELAVPGGCIPLWYRLYTAMTSVTPVAGTRRKRKHKLFSCINLKA
jgi:hypothetical protein